MSYNFRARIAEGDLRKLIDGGWNLCITQSFADGDMPLQGNVVFAVVKSNMLAPWISYTFDQTYQVYMTRTFEPGKMAKPETEVFDIGLGESITFDKNGGGTFGVGKPGAITVKNDWKDQGYIGISMGIGGNYSTTFISPPSGLQNTKVLSPIDAFGVFFSQEYNRADTMINVATTEIFPFSFLRSSADLEYKDGKWSRLLQK